MEEFKRTAWRALHQLPSRVADADGLLHDDCEFHVSHPMNLLIGAANVVARLYEPMLQAFPDLARRADIFMAGQWDGHIDGGGGLWVATTGHYLGTMRASWLGIPASGRTAFVRYGEFYRWVDGRIVEARVLLDLVDVARQCGVPILPPSSGVELLVPGPVTHDGLLLGPSDPARSKASLDLVMAMIGGLKRFDRKDLHSMGMEQYWTPDMMWYGPCGIGTARGVDGFQRHHQRPFLNAFPDRVGGHHRARIADGAYVASTGWPSVRAHHLGEYLGVAATGASIGMRVMDWWRVEGDRLAENWVFIDLPHLFLQLGIDLMGRLALHEEERAESGR